MSGLPRPITLGGHTKPQPTKQLGVSLPLQKPLEASRRRPVSWSMTHTEIKGAEGT